MINKFLSFEKNQISARQVPEIILSESSKDSENALIEWLQKETTRYFPKTKEYVVSFVLSLACKTVFGIFLGPLVCLKSVIIIIYFVYINLII
jgi:hypothetical protein